MSKTTLEKVFSNKYVQLAALAAGGLALLRNWKKDSVSGVGALYININRATLNEANRLFRNYDLACEIERDHSERSDAIFEDLEARGIDWQSEEGEKIANELLFRAGLSDRNGNTDVYVNKVNARKDLLNFIYYELLPLFPIKKGDLELIRNSRNYAKQDELIQITREYVNKMTL